jgi:hypothetical protein
MLTLRRNEALIRFLRLSAKEPREREREGGREGSLSSSAEREQEKDQQQQNSNNARATHRLSPLSTPKSRSPRYSSSLSSSGGTARLCEECERLPASLYCALCIAYYCQQCDLFVHQIKVCIPFSNLHFFRYCCSICRSLDRMKDKLCERMKREVIKATTMISLHFTQRAAIV